MGCSTFSEYTVVAEISVAKVNFFVKLHSFKNFLIVVLNER